MRSITEIMSEVEKLEEYPDLDYIRSLLESRDQDWFDEIDDYVVKLIRQSREPIR
jgi:uncharacterized protein YeeX (DUF496 family)